MSALLRSDLGNCAVLTLNRPESLNAINTEMLELLEQQLDDIENDSGVRAVIITGEGRAFCPGTDLKQPPEDSQARMRRVHALVTRMHTYPKLTVAAINGLALGGGLELALGCTFRVAVADAPLGLPEIKIGLMPAYGGTVLLPRLIGAARAEQMMLSGKPVLAEEGLSMGLVNAIADSADQVVQRAHDFVQAYCCHSLVPQQAIRRAIREGAELSMADALAHECEIMEGVSTSEDCVEGVMSFIEKRDPVWKDR